MPASPPRWWSSATSTARAIKRAEIGREAFLEHVWEWKAQIGRRDHPPAPPPRRVLRLGARALHHGRALPARGHPHLRRAPQARPDLPRQAPGELGPQVPDRDQRPRGREPRSQRPHVALQISARGRPRPTRTSSATRDGKVLFEEERDYISIATTRPETMLGDGAVAVHPDDERYRPIVGKLLRDPGRAEGASAADPDHHRRLSRPAISARARSRSPAGTTSTTMASRSATACRCTG